MNKNVDYRYKIFLVLISCYLQGNIVQYDLGQICHTNAVLVLGLK